MIDWSCPYCCILFSFQKKNQRNGHILNCIKNPCSNKHKHKRPLIGTNVICEKCNANFTVFISKNKLDNKKYRKRCFICSKNGNRYSNEIKNKVIEAKINGSSLSEICLKFGVAKGTASLWTRRVPKKQNVTKKLRKSVLNKSPKFSDEIIQNIVDLYNKQFLVVEIASKLKISLTGVARVLKRKNLSLLVKKERDEIKWKNEAVSLFDKNKNNPLFLLGIGLYWGEGSKRGNVLQICNSDPFLIKNWLLWCKEFIPNRNLQFRLSIHSSSNEGLSQNFWTNVLGFDILKDFKIYKLKQRTKKTLNEVINRMPYGVMRVNVGVGSTEEKIKMLKYFEILQNNMVSVV